MKFGKKGEVGAASTNTTAYPPEITVGDIVKVSHGNGYECEFVVTNMDTVSIGYEGFRKSCASDGRIRLVKVHKPLFGRETETASADAVKPEQRVGDETACSGRSIPSASHIDRL